MQLFVKLPSHGIKTVCVYSFNTIEDVKNMLGIVGYNLYTNKLLEDHHTIEHYGLINNSTIHALGRGIGGIPIAQVVPQVALTFNPTELAAAMTANIHEISYDSMTFAQKVVYNVKSVLHQISEKLHWAKQILTAVKFFPIITFILILLACFGKPLEIIMLIIGLLFIAMLYIIYSILNLPPFIYIVALLYFIVFEIIPFIAYCIIFTAILVLIFVICLVLTGVNIGTGGALKNVVLCDNSPGAWYKTANHHLGNKWERGLLCSRPCGARYAPDAGGMSCIKTPKGYPPYCPQAEIMRIYATKQADKHYMYKTFAENSNLKYLSRPPEEREKMLADYYIRKTKFSETCRKEMSEYDPISLNICASANTLGLENSELIKLKQVCAQAYCTADKNYPFCSKISSLKEDDENALIQQIIKVVVIILAFFIITIFMFKTLYGSSSEGASSNANTGGAKN